MKRTQKNKIFAIIGSCLLAVTSFFAFTPKNVNADSAYYERFSMSELYDTNYFRNEPDFYIRGSNFSTSIEYNLYDSFSSLNIPSISNTFLNNDNKLTYNIYSSDRELYQYVCHKSSRSDSLYRYSTCYFDSDNISKLSYNFNNLVLFYYDSDNFFTFSDFEVALNNYFKFIDFSYDSNVNCDLKFSSTIFSDFNGNSYNSYSSSTSFSNINLSSLEDCLQASFTWLFDANDEISKPIYANTSLTSDLYNYVSNNNDILNTYNKFIIIPSLTIEVSLYQPTRLYLLSKYFYSTQPITNYDILYEHSIYNVEFINDLLSNFGLFNSSNFYDLGFESGYSKGSKDAKLQPFDYIVGTVESFLNFELFPDFHFYYILLIALGFSLFGLLVKYALGG